MDAIYPNKPHITHVECLAENRIKVTATCAVSGSSNTMEIPVSLDILEHWIFNSDVLIKDVMPDTTPSEREFLMTGITDSMWDQLFGEFED